MESCKFKLTMRFFKSFLNTLVFATCLSVAFTGGITYLAVFYIGVELLSLATSYLPKGILGADVYADTVLQAARAFIKDENNRKFQQRPNFTNLIDIYLRDREFTMPSLGDIRQADTQATEALYINKKTFATGSAKSCTPSGEQTGSSKVTLTWDTITVSVKSNFKQHSGNEVKAERALANDLFNAEVSLWEAVDADLLAHLEANKSTVNAGSSGTFAVDVMNIPSASKNDFYNLVTADMQANNFMPTFLHGHYTAWTADQRRYINQGAGNSTNTQFQFAGFDFMPSNLITGELSYIVPEGGVAILDWNDPLNVAGKSIGDKSWTTMQSILKPEFTFDVYRTEDCADTSADGGGTQDSVTTWEIAFNYSKAVQPLASGTPIFKYNFV